MFQKEFQSRQIKQNQCWLPAWEMEPNKLHIIIIIQFWCMSTHLNQTRIGHFKKTYLFLSNGLTNQKPEVEWKEVHLHEKPSLSFYSVFRLFSSQRVISINKINSPSGKLNLLTGFPLITILFQQCFSSPCLTVLYSFKT